MRISFLYLNGLTMLHDHLVDLFEPKGIQPVQ